MNREESEIYAKQMTYRDAVYNALCGRAIPYRKATMIKLHELLEIADKADKEEELSSITTPFPEHKYIEVKDFARLEREGKLQKGKLYIVHGSVEDMEKLRRKGMTKEQARQWIYSKFNSGEAEKLLADLIIKALEKEPCDDTWSIKDVAKAFEKHGLIEQEPCSDVISRQALDEIKGLMTDINGDTVYAVRMSDIRQLPSVNPQEPCSNCCNGNQIEKSKLCQKSYLAGMEHQQEPKIGEWIKINVNYFNRYQCNQCDRLVEEKTDFCPHCGADMRGDAE